MSTPVRTRDGPPVVPAGDDKAARRRAESAMNKLLTQVDNQRSVESSVSLGHALDEWMLNTELEDSTRRTYGWRGNRSWNTAGRLARATADRAGRALPNIDMRPVPPFG